MTDPFITRPLSRYLDACRFLLAVGVVASHLDEFGYPISAMPFAHLGHEYVVGFFVLSGLVVSHSAIGGAKTMADYILARASRILSVSMPAIALSLGLFWLGAWLKPDGLVRTLAAAQNSLPDLTRILTFTSESWVSGLSLTWNGPYWSICYEVWFYVLLGAFLYAPPSWRWPLTGGLGLLAGPKILLLLPCWLLGVALFRWGSTCRLSLRQAQALLAVTVLAAAVVIASGLSTTLRDGLRVLPGYWRLDYSQLFLTDFLLALCFSAHLIAVRRLLEARQLEGWFVRACQKGAGYSFSTYLFHLPLLNFLALMQIPLGKTPIAAWVLLGVVLIACMMLGRVTEDRQSVVRGWLAAYLKKQG